MHRAQGAAPSPALATCIPAHPAALRGDPLGPAPASVIPVSLRAQRGEEDPAAPRALGQLRARAGSLGGSGLPLPLPPLSAGAHGQLAASAAFGNVPEKELQAFPSFTWKILFPSAITQTCLDGKAPVEFYCALNTNYFRDARSNPWPKRCHKGTGAKLRLRLGDCYKPGFITSSLVSAPLDPHRSGSDRRALRSSQRLRGQTLGTSSWKATGKVGAATGGSGFPLIFQGLGKLPGLQHRAASHGTKGGTLKCPGAGSTCRAAEEGGELQESK